jgi:Ran GTPase-activating protein 1
MVDFLSTNRHFQVLRLNNNGLGIQGGSIVASALIKLADRLKEAGEESQLRTVICGRNRLENGSAPVWAEAFKKHGGLKEVRMFQNGIRMEGIEVLSQGLSHCKSLEILDFQDNTATVRGSRAIAKALPSWPSLTTLNLSDTLLKPRGGALIFEQLAKGSNTKLETLQLQYNDLDRKALSTLASAIGRHLSSLAKLEINGNWADEEDDCIEAIKKALESHGHEEGLDELDEMDPEGEEDSDAEEDERDEEDEAEVSQATAAVVVGGASGASATTAASEVPSKEPMAVPSSSATSVATKDKTESVTDSLVSSAHGEDKKIAEVAADVSRSAQAVPEKKEQIDATADVGASAQAVYEQDEKDKHGDSALDDLTKQLAGAGIGSSQ